jgi:hypothetical protein
LRIILIIALGFLCRNIESIHPPTIDYGHIEVNGFTSVSTFSLSASLKNNHITFEPNEHGHVCQLKIPVIAFKSGEKELDLDFYKMVKSDIFPHILLSLPINNNTINKGSIRQMAHVQISGKKNYEDIIFSYVLAEDGTIKLIGSMQILLTNYYLTPPTKLLGIIRVKNNVNINFVVSTRLP